MRKSLPALHMRRCSQENRKHYLLNRCPGHEKWSPIKSLSRLHKRLSSMLSSAYSSLNTSSQKDISLSGSNAKSLASSSSTVKQLSPDPAESRLTVSCPHLQRSPIGPEPSMIVGPPSRRISKDHSPPENDMEILSDCCSGPIASPQSRLLKGSISPTGSLSGCSSHRSSPATSPTGLPTLPPELNVELLTSGDTTVDTFIDLSPSSVAPRRRGGYRRSRRARGRPYGWFTQRKKKKSPSKVGQSPVLVSEHVMSGYPVTSLQEELYIPFQQDKAKITVPESEGFVPSHDYEASDHTPKLSDDEIPMEIENQDDTNLSADSDISSDSDSRPLLVLNSESSNVASCSLSGAEENHSDMSESINGGVRTNCSLPLETLTRIYLPTKDDISDFGQKPSSIEDILLSQKFSERSADEISADNENTSTNTIASSTVTKASTPERSPRLLRQRKGTETESMELESVAMPCASGEPSDKEASTAEGQTEKPRKRFRFLHRRKWHKLTEDSTEDEISPEPALMPPVEIPATASPTPEGSPVISLGRELRVVLCRDEVQHFNRPSDIVVPSTSTGTPSKTLSIPPTRKIISRKKDTEKPAVPEREAFNPFTYDWSDRGKCKKDVVDCICGDRTDSGLMLQCDLCLTWLHGPCVSYFEVHQIPKQYICSACQLSKLHDGNPTPEVTQQLWASTGTLPELTSLPNGPLSSAYMRLMHELLNRSREVTTSVTTLESKRKYIMALIDDDKLEEVDSWLKPVEQVYDRLEREEAQRQPLGEAVAQASAPDDATSDYVDFGDHSYSMRSVAPVATVATDTVPEEKNEDFERTLQGFMEPDIPDSEIPEGETRSSLDTVNLKLQFKRRALNVFKKVAVKIRACLDMLNCQYKDLQTSADIPTGYVGKVMRMIKNSDSLLQIITRLDVALKARPKGAVRAGAASHKENLKKS